MKRVIITGVSRGIGKATAEKFLQEGWYVIGTSTSGTGDISNANLEMVSLDMSQAQSIQQFVSSLKQKGEKADALVNNAGVLINPDNPVLDVNDLRKTLEVNLFGLIELTENLLPFISNGGHIVNLSSQLASLTDTSGSRSSAYKISKAAVNMYTRTLAIRLKNRNIRVSSLNPGWVKTDMGGANASRIPAAPASEIFELVTANVESGYFWYQGRKMNW
jgi:NAD(P)-dependent dehydrogenase (short-subunit alcohol dehydrogenase family)